MVNVAIKIFTTQNELKHRSQNIDGDISRMEGEEEYRRLNVLDFLQRGRPENGENSQVIRKMDNFVRSALNLNWSSYSKWRKRVQMTLSCSFYCRSDSTRERSNEFFDSNFEFCHG